MAEIFWDQYKKQWMVRDEMDADEARNVAYALGLGDLAAQDLLRAADEAEERNNG